MQLVFIYGPPAAGKYTIGKMVAEQTGFTFLHNHISANLVRELIGDVYDPVRMDMVHKIRLALYEGAARLGRDCVVTHAYNTDFDVDWITEVIAAVESNGGTISFVRVTAPVDVLLERVANPSRTALHKLDNIEGMQRRFRERDYFSEIAHPNHLSIDTGEISADQACRAIINHFGLSVGRSLGH
jgi:shikimate kinase